MRRFAKFGIVGISNTLITIIAYMLLVYMGVNYIYANIISYGLGVINSYYWNKNWVFKANSNSIYLFVKFIIVNFITLGCNTLILYGLVDSIGLNAIIAQLIATCLGLGINFTLNNIWTFNTGSNNKL